VHCTSPLPSPPPREDDDADFPITAVAVGAGIGVFVFVLLGLGVWGLVRREEDGYKKAPLVVPGATGVVVHAAFAFKDA